MVCVYCDSAIVIVHTHYLRGSCLRIQIIPIGDWTKTKEVGSPDDVIMTMLIHDSPRSLPTLPPTAAACERGVPIEKHREC
jgi:hypothetical protein